MTSSGRRISSMTGEEEGRISIAGRVALSAAEQTDEGGVHGQGMCELLVGGLCDVHQKNEFVVKFHTAS